ncbi:hypothetical protein FN846DRAFT_921650 [Sphaerosporella brunnea]|uniref:Uncharacterized protein n=1 Tax=Sphaerosporella brunnea TaxID=1250544 RepID=A0A5J5ENU0_9PEZI|nr:hypothetical protein FN846DRAFT_921650 [Sphaerosporella brunnea]
MPGKPVSNAGKVASAGRSMGNTNYNEPTEALCVDRTVSPKLEDCAMRSDIRLSPPRQATVVLEHYFLDHEDWLCDRANHTKWNPGRVERLIATKTFTTDEWWKKAVELGDNLGVETPLRTDMELPIAACVRSLFFKLACELKEKEPVEILTKGGNFQLVAARRPCRRAVMASAES